MSAKPEAKLLFGRLDGWLNTVTGLGTWRDKAKAAAFERGPKTPDQQLEDLYRADDMFARVVDTLPDESFREGFCVEIEADEQSTEGEDVDVDTALEELHVEDRFMEAAAFARLFGGAVIYMGVEDGKEASEPIDLNSIGSLSFLNVIDRRGMRPATYYSNPLEKDYGKIQSYYVTAAGLANMPAAPIDTQPINVEIHESRLIIFDAIRCTPRMRAEAFGFSPSVFERFKEPLAQFSQIWQSTANLMLDGSQGVFKIKNLIAMITGVNRKALEDRMEAIDLSRSVARALVLDETESFTREDADVSGHAQIIDKAAIRLAAAARMPVTILFGQSPTGLNATGDADIRWWYDTVRAYQKHYLRPRIMRLLAVLFAAQDGPTAGVTPDSYSVRFFPLYQPTAVEEQNRRKSIAERDQIYMVNQVLTPEEVALGRFSHPDGFDRELSINGEIREKLLEAALQKMTPSTAIDPATTPPGIDTLENTAPGLGTKGPPPTTRGPSSLTEPNLEGKST